MKLQCDNCSHTADYDDFPEAEDFHTRNSIGFLFSDKECPKCGALAFPVPEGAEAERERTRDAARTFHKTPSRQFTPTYAAQSPRRKANSLSGEHLTGCPLVRLST